MILFKWCNKCKKVTQYKELESMKWMEWKRVVCAECLVPKRCYKCKKIMPHRLVKWRDYLDPNSKTYTLVCVKCDI